MTPTTHMTIWPQADVVDLWQEHISARPHLKGILAEALVQMINPLHIETTDMAYSWQICEYPAPHVHLKLSHTAPQDFWTKYLNIFDAYMSDQVASLRLWLNLPVVQPTNTMRVSFDQKEDVVGPILCETAFDARDHALVS